MSESYKQLVEQVNASFAEGDIEQFLVLCTDDVEWTMIGEGTHTGKQDIRDWMGSMPSEPPVTNSATFIVEGDRVACYGDMTMKDKSGATTTYSYCDLYRFQGDQISELRSFVMRSDGGTDKKE